MLKGLIVDNMVIGGPAYNSGALKRGDIILAVDGMITTEESVISMLLGQDIPGSMVTLRISRPNQGLPFLICLTSRQKSGLNVCLQVALLILLTCRCLGWHQKK